MVVARSRRGPAPLSVTQLAALIHDALETELGRVLVAGEISNLRHAPSGHVYFTLKDERSQMRCVMFRSAAQLLVFTPADGQQVIVRGQIDVYAARGDLQLYVDSLEPEGRGALQLAFEQLKARLAAEGLFDEARKRPLPFFPRHVGVATALGGAAIRDVLVTLRRRCPALHVVVRPTKVQGPGAADDIVEAIDDLNAHPALEVLIVGRGGGSLEDLWPFNEERVARAIAASRLPVVSAVGHEIDFTIADLVADRRAATPTAAAELVAPDLAELESKVARCAASLVAALARRIDRERGRVLQLARRVRDPRRRIDELRVRMAGVDGRLRAVIQRRLAVAAEAIDRAEHRLAIRHPEQLIALTAERVATAERRLALAIRHALRRERDALGRASGALHDLSPLAVLERGYSLTRRLADHAIVRDAAALAADDEVEITFAAGRARARITARQRGRTD